MAHVMFSNNTFPWFTSDEDRSVGKIRLSIFLITGECVGLPALVWALSVLYRRYKTGGRISAFVVTLLLCDLLVLLLNPYIVTELIQNENCWKKSLACWTFSSLWSGSLICALHLQSVVALEGALSSRHFFCSAHFFFPSCSIIISITVFSFFFLCELLEATLYTLLGLPLSVALTVISFIVTCRAPPNIDDIPYRTLKPSRTVLAFTTGTVILYVILCVFLWRDWSEFVMWYIFMCSSVITDPLLCALVYRTDLWVQIPQTPAEPNTNIELFHIQDSDTPNTHTAQSV